jgi:membrane protease YdiL (CAAX protease family)
MTTESVSPPIQPTISRKRWWIHWLLITGYILLVSMVGLGRKGTHTAMLSQTSGGLLVICLLELLFFGVFFGLAWLASRATRDDLLLRWKGTYQPVLLGAGYSIAIRVALAVLVAMLAMVLIASHVMSSDSLNDFLSANRPNVEAMVNMTDIRNDPVYFWLTLTVVSFLLGGVREELWRSAFLAGMRNLWPQHFGSRAGQVLAVIICAAFFGFAHLVMGPLAAFMAGLIGVGLGLIMVFHKSIWPAVIAHGLFDAASLAMLPWALEHTAKVLS